jgi:hypothetical protein
MDHSHRQRARSQPVAASCGPVPFHGAATTGAVSVPTGLEVRTGPGLCFGTLFGIRRAREMLYTSGIPGI